MDNIVYSFSDLFGHVFDSFNIVMGGLADGVKGAFNELFYADAMQRTSVSPLVMFAFAVGGFALACGVVYGVFGWVRGKARDRG